MQRNNTAHRSCAPTQNPHPTPLATLPEIQPPRTIALGQLIIRNRKTAIVITGAIVLIALFWIAPTLATGLVFAAGLFGINTLIDSRMAGGNR